MRIDPNNGVLLALQKCFDMMVTTLLFLLCCLPVATAGASITAALDTAMDIAADKCSGVVKKFFSSFRENFFLALKLWLPALAAGAVLYLDVYACWGWGGAPEAALAVLKGLTVFAGLFYLAFLTYGFGGAAKFRVTARQALHNAFCWSMGHPLYTLGLVLLSAGMLFSIWLLWFYAFFALALGLYLQAKLLLRSMLEQRPEKGGDKRDGEVYYE